MLDDPITGPMFDPEDGTVGRIQLQLRWALTSLRMVWPQPKAVFMYDDQFSASEHLRLLRETGRQIPHDLTVETWWCWPASLCPAYLAKKEGA